MIIYLSNHSALIGTIDLKFINYLYIEQYSIESILKKFLNEFSLSPASTLHEYINNLENDFLFINQDINKLGQSPLAFPKYGKQTSYGRQKALSKFQIALLSMNIISKTLSNTNKDYICYDAFIELSLFDFFHFMKEDKSLMQYFNMLHEELLYQLSFNLSYTTTTSLKPKRLYFWEDGDDFTLLLKQFFDAKLNWEQKKSVDQMALQLSKVFDKEDYQAGSFLNHWLQQFEVAHHATIEPHIQGTAATIHLFNEHDNTGFLITDKGIGVL